MALSRLRSHEAMKHSPRVPRILTPSPAAPGRSSRGLRTVANRTRAENLPEPPALRRAAVLALLDKMRAGARGAGARGPAPRPA